MLLPKLRINDNPGIFIIFFLTQMEIFIVILKIHCSSDNSTEDQGSVIVVTLDLIETILFSRTYFCL